MSDKEWLDPVKFGQLCEQVRVTSESIDRLADSVEGYVRATNERLSAGQKKMNELDTALELMSVNQRNDLERLKTELQNKYRTIIAWLIILTVLSLPFRIAELVRLVIGVVG